MVRPAGPAEGLRLLAVHAHPDDESSKGAATMARYVSEGAEVMVATCTGGERGDPLNPAMDTPEVRAHLPEIRRAEMAAAASILGIEHAWLGFVDSGLPEGDPLPPLPEGCFAVQPLEIAAAPLVALVRRFRPHVILTYDEKGGYPHPDHVMTHVVSVEAWEAAGDPTRYPDLGEPWTPQKLYYFISFQRERLVALHNAALEAGLESPFAEWLEKRPDIPEDALKTTTRIECGEFFAQRDAALLAHASQIDPAGRWFQLPIETQRKAWPTEDYQLAASRVETSLPETDLFSGVREVVHA